MHDATKVDYVGLWEVYAQATKQFPTESKSGQKAIAVEIARQMLISGSIVFGFESEISGALSVVVWKDQDPDVVAETISKSWSELATDPNPGDICWFMRP